jgi:hypothetical protein
MIRQKVSRIGNTEFHEYRREDQLLKMTLQSHKK